MKRTIKAIGLAIVVCLLLTQTALAAFTALIQVVNTSGTVFDMMAANVTTNIKFMADNGYFGGNQGLDTRVLLGTAERPHMLADDRLMFALPVPLASSQTLTFSTGSSNVALFPVIVGESGNITFADASNIELSDNFTYEFVGYVNTDNGTLKNLINKEGVFRVFVSDTVSGNITAVIGSLTPADITLRPDGAGDETNIAGSTGTHWVEVSTQDDITFVNTTNGTFERDLYTADDSSVNGVVNSITFFIRGNTNAGGPVTTVKPHFKIGGVVYDGAEQTIGPGSTFATKSEVFTTSPATNLAWTFPEINAMQIGASLKNDSGVTSRISEVWIVVNYSGLIVSATGVSSGEIVVRVTIETVTDTFFPDADTETTSVDGNASHSDAADRTFSFIVAAGGNSASDTAPADNVIFFRADGATDKWRFLRRGIILFDTSALPDSVLIDSSVFSAFGASKTDPLSIAPDINLYSSAPASDTAIVAGDYDSLGTTPFSDNISFANWDTSGYNDFNLNASGIAAIDSTGISKFGLRNANYDVADELDPGNHDPSWSSGQLETGIAMDFSEAGAGSQPRLTVTYRQLVISIDGVEADSEAFVSAISVVDNSANWTAIQNSVAPFSDNQSLIIGGILQLQYQPNTILADIDGLSATLPDMSSGTDNPGTINWGGNPTGVAVTLASLVSDFSVSAVSTTGTQDVVRDIELPSNVVDATRLTNLQASDPILYPIFDAVNTLTGIAILAQYWMFFMVLALVAFAVTYSFIPNLFISGAVFDIVIGFAIAFGVYDFWVIAVMLIVFVGAAVMEGRQPS